MPIGCRGCPDQFDSEQSARLHFIESHALNKCLLCERPNSAPASNFCPTCKSVFLPEINQIEGITSQVNALQTRVANFQQQKRSKMIALKTRFIARQADLFCSHNIPKDDNCPACEKFNAREVRSSKNIIHVDL